MIRPLITNNRNILSNYTVSFTSFSLTLLLALQPLSQLSTNNLLILKQGLPTFYRTKLINFLYGQ